MTGGPGAPGPDLLPALGVSRLLLIATGSVAAADLPFWSTWLRTYYRDLEVRAVLTPSARRFVTPAALEGRLTGDVADDVWHEDDRHARHVELGAWAEAMLVFPCTLNYLARLALGLADSPSLLAAQCTSVPVALAPALPPGGPESAAYRGHLATLSRRPNIAVVPPQPGFSLTAGRQGAWAPALLPTCVTELEQVRRRLAGAPAEPAAPPCPLPTDDDVPATGRG